MEDVTDTVFRRLLRYWSHAVSQGRSAGPAVMFTEFTRVDGAIRTAAGDRPNGRLRYTDDERPLIAQIWGTRPEEYRRAAAALEHLGFDGIDLNMGCPAKKIRKAGACSALIGNPALAAEIIAACRAGSRLALSVKTRIGLAQPQTERWVSFLLEQGLDALTVHPRVADQLSEGVADWSELATVVSLRDQIAPETVILGNGDCRSVEDARARVQETGVDGVMFGRGIFADPLLFARPESPELPAWPEIPREERLRYLREQIVAFTREWGTGRNYEVLKKFFRNYVCTGSPAEAALLEALYATHAPEEALRLLPEPARGASPF
jgi:tRNA-dihydrouridine synthase